MDRFGEFEVVLEEKRYISAPTIAKHKKVRISFTFLAGLGSGISFNAFITRYTYVG